MQRLPSLKSLRVFEACVRLGSFSRAAKELNVGQPAVSHQIRSLELDLGKQLFERQGTRAIPNEAAMIYYRVVAGAFEDVARASQGIRQSTRAPGLRIGTYPGIAMFWLMPKLAKLKKRNPGLTIRVTTAERDQDIPFEDLDCAILFGDGRWAGHESRCLIREAVVPIAAPAVAASEQLRVPASLLRQGPLIHLEDQDTRWFTWSDWRDQRSPETRAIDSGITVTNHGIAIHEALIGQGVALGWMGVVDELIDSGLLVTLDPKPITSKRGYHIVARKGFLDARPGVLLLNALQKRT
jgi:LysR family transcriptional regulator, glycine cleavage system transcriptional activator